MARTIVNRHEATPSDLELDLRGEMGKLPPAARIECMLDYAARMDADARDARRLGWYEQANFMAELAHQFRCGHVVMPGDFIGMEALLDYERRALEETLNTGLKPMMPSLLN